MRLYESKMIFLLIFTVLIFIFYSLFSEKNFNEKVTPLEKNSFLIENLDLNVRLFNSSDISCNNTDFNEIIAKIDINLPTLEIGPFNAPHLKGKNVKYFDILDRNGLFNKAMMLNLKKTNNIPDIDYVEPSGNLSNINEKFMNIFSSHNIEHQIDLISHLNQIYDLLENTGKLFLLIPDKRFCFDHYIPETFLSDVLQSHYLISKRHTLKNSLTICERTHNIGHEHWNNLHGESLHSDSRLECYKNILNKFMMSEDYIDTHQWRFYPESFIFIFNSLYRFGLIRLKIEKVFCTPKNTFNFFVVLRK